MKTPQDDVNRLDQQLAKLDAEFSRKLPARLKEISDGCHRLLLGAAARTDLESLHSNVHKLAGSGTSFGSPGISAAALALGRSLKVALAGRKADSKRISAELSALEAAVEQRLAGVRGRPGA